MRLLILLLFMGVFASCLVGVLNPGSGDGPADEARKFLHLIQVDDYNAALTEFGDNTCHCAPKGGYIAYLRLDKENDPNLAFLRGQRFEIGKITVHKLPPNGEKYIFPWEKPEDVAVYVPLTFPDAANRPYFLPMDMAFGHEMPEADLKKFASDPSPDWQRAFTLRLRNTLAPGLFDEANKQTQPEDADTAKLVEQKVLPAQALEYMHPKDAAPVSRPDGKPVAALAVAGELPRLKSLIVGLKIVRRGSFHRWAVKKIAVDNPVVVTGGKETALSH